MWELSKANLKSLLIHTWILFVWALVVMLPEIRDYLSTIMQPELAALIIMWLWIVLKKLLNSK